MKKFEITKCTFDGKVEVVYNAGILESLNFSESKMNLKQLKGFKEVIPVNENDLEQFSAATGSRVRETAFVITFEMWYENYGLLRNKKQALELWNKMPTEEHLQCWLSNKHYKNYCARNANWYNKMYPDTYLRQKHYWDEWNKI